MKDNNEEVLGSVFFEKVQEEYDKMLSANKIMLNWLKSILEVYETGGTYNQYAIRIKENFADPQGALKVIKEWLDEGKS